MKITETTPQADRMFMIEATAAELRIIWLVLGEESPDTVKEKALGNGIKLNDIDADGGFAIYSDIEDALDADGN